MCSSPEILELLHTIDANMNVIVNDIKDNLRVLNSVESINNQYINRFIKNTMEQLLSNQTRKGLIVLNQMVIEMYEILEPKRVNTKSSFQNIKDSVTSNYLFLIKDIIHFYNGNITSTFKKYISKKIINIIGDFRFNINNLDTYHAFYNLLRNLRFYNKRLGNRQLYEILGFIKNDFVFSWYYDCLSEEKKILFIYTHDTLYEYIQSKYHTRQIRITPVLISNGICETQLNMNECAICLEEYQKKNEILLECGHPFCKNCMIKTIKNNIEKQKIPPCPLCRSDILSVKVYDNELCNVFTSNFA